MVGEIDRRKGKWRLLYHDGWDEDSDDWEPGDMLLWEMEVGTPDPELIIIDHIQHDVGYVYWLGEDGKQEMTRETNLVRIRKAAKSGPE